MSKTLIGPTAIARASRCLHSWYLECFGDPSEKREPDAGLLLMFDVGLNTSANALHVLKGWLNLSGMERILRRGSKAPCLQ